MNTVIACGGTGGHLFPGLAVAEVLRARGHEVMLFVSEKEIDALALSGRSEFRFHQLPTIGLPSPFSPAILGFLRRFNESLSLCRGIYRKFKPHVVLGMGGFTSTAPVLAGKMRGIPTFIHESNAIPGKANRLTARMVRAVLLGFKECAPFFPKVRTEVTGTPIRKELQRLDRKIARQRLGLRVSLLVVFLFVVIIVCGMMIALHAKDRAGLLLGCGIVSLLGLQAAVNIGVTTSLLPNKGLPLPFVSYGGSNLAACLFGIGLLLNIYRQGVLEPANQKRTMIRARTTPRI